MKIKDFNRVVIALTLAACVIPQAQAQVAVEQNNDSEMIGDPCGAFTLAPGKNSTISNEESFSSPNSCKFAIAEGHDGFGGTFPHTHLYKGDEIWFQFKMFMPAGFDYGAYGAGSQLKFIAVGVRTAGETSTTLFVELRREDVAPTPYTACITSGPNNPFWKNFGAPGDKPQRGVWETYEVYLKFDNVSVVDGGTGRLRFWKNNILIKDITNLGTLNNATDYSRSLGIFTYWNATAPKTQHLYIDDILATNQTPTNTDANGNLYIGVDTLTSVEQQNKTIASFNIYPNPFTASTTIDFSYIKKSASDNLSFHLFNVLGREVATYNTISTEKLVLKKNNLKVGIYFYKVSMNNKAVRTGKLIIE